METKLAYQKQFKKESFGKKVAKKLGTLLLTASIMTTTPSCFTAIALTTVERKKEAVTLCSIASDVLMIGGAALYSKHGKIQPENKSDMYLNTLFMLPSGLGVVSGFYCVFVEGGVEIIRKKCYPAGGDFIKCEQ